ncbi:DUF4442 domain-containing protein [uncultured Croceitalea sp.]|uniref:DUF4442 domain-containing protein n=1 Tax=uncultured Croceitalea sp. TaxID=1798908 RepID=UPI0033058E4C
MTKIGTKLIGRDKLFKYGFNLSPMYRRSTAKISSVSKDLYKITIKLPISYKNKNYVNSIFGGSMFSAIDPIPMVQLINILGDDYVVWDKSAEIFFKRPARENLFADFEFTSVEVNDIKSRVAQHNEIEIIRVTKLTDKSRDKVFCEVHKTIYIADKNFYKEKRKRRKQ